jgi:hypothetical protein
MEHWMEDRSKDEERYSNTICFTWCLKWFSDRNRVELWRKDRGYCVEFKTEQEARFTYKIIRGLNSNEDILFFAEKQMRLL